MIEGKQTPFEYAKSQIGEADRAMMVQYVRNAMVEELQKFAIFIQDQDFSLRILGETFCNQAGKGEAYVLDLKEKDRLYKQSVIKLGLSIIKLSLEAVNLSELVDIADHLTTIAESSMEKIEEKLDSLVGDIKIQLIYAESLAFEQAEVALANESNPQTLKENWIIYQNIIHEKAQDGINQVLERSLKTDEFAWATVLACMEDNPNPNDVELPTLEAQKEVKTHQKEEQSHIKRRFKEEAIKTWQVLAAKKAKAYVKDIYAALEEKLKIIKTVKENAMSTEGQTRLEEYFIKAGLIDYVKSLEEKQGRIDSWLTSKLGRELQRQFPEIVYQKKLRPLWLRTPERYRARKALKEGAQHRLSVFTNTDGLKFKLTTSLLEKREELYTELCDFLKTECTATVPEKGVSPITPEATLFRRKSSGRYSFYEPQGLFSSTASSEESADSTSISSHDMKLKRRLSYQVSKSSIYLPTQNEGPPKAGDPDLPASPTNAMNEDRLEASLMLDKTQKITPTKK